MANYIEQISSLENLMLAWRKLERAFNHGDVWFDELVISAFRMNLVRNLKVLKSYTTDKSFLILKSISFSLMFNSFAKCQNQASENNLQNIWSI